MLERDTQALKQQYHRLRVFLTMAYCPCVVDVFTNEWREADTWDAKAIVVRKWVQCITESDIVLFAGDDDAA